MTAALPVDAGAVPDLPVASVCQVVDRSFAGPFAPMLGQVLPGLAASGLRVRLLTDDPALVQRLAGSPVQCQHVPHVAGWRAWPSARSAALHPPPGTDLLHIWGTGGLWWVRASARTARVPLVVHVTGWSHVHRLLRGGLGDREHLVLAAAALAEPILRRHRVVAERCHHVPLAIAPPLSPPRRAESGHVVGAVCASPLRPGHGLEVLIRAVAELVHGGLDIQVALIGQGEHAEAVWREVRAARVGQHVSLVDVPALWEHVLPDIDLCIVPACERELSLAPILAMALGKCVIAARGQLAEWFVEDLTAWHFTPGAHAELAELLARACTEPSAAQSLGESAAAYVRERHAIRALVAELLRLYGDVRKREVAAR